MMLAARQNRVPLVAPFRLGVIAIGNALAVVCLAGCEGTQSALDPRGPAARDIADLWWGLLIGAALIFVAVMMLLLVGIWRARRSREPRPLDQVQSRNLVLFGGVVIPLVILCVFIAASAFVERSTTPELPPDALTVQVTGHRWWWEVNYLDQRGNRIATTANEIHAPVGRPVRLLLESRDVIHSFWVPNLQGKTDLIPGRTNTSWFIADEPGLYRGQCAEFCGMQHARMAFLIVAQAPEAFDAWLATQREPAGEPADPVLVQGRQVFLSSSCFLCHTIRGTHARGTVAPDLTHFGSRKTIAAGTLPNARGHLAGWIADPQSIKPGNAMPATKLDSESLTAVVSYLQSLQ